jgi:hypothetical protein
MGRDNRLDVSVNAAPVGGPLMPRLAAGRVDIFGSAKRFGGKEKSQSLRTLELHRTLTFRLKGLRSLGELADREPRDSRYA